MIENICPTLRTRNFSIKLLITAFRKKHKVELQNNNAKIFSEFYTIRETLNQYREKSKIQHHDGKQIIPKQVQETIYFLQMLKDIQQKFSHGNDNKFALHIQNAIIKSNEQIKVEEHSHKKNKSLKRLKKKMAINAEIMGVYLSQLNEIYYTTTNEISSHIKDESIKKGSLACLEKIMNGYFEKGYAVVLSSAFGE